MWVAWTFSSRLSFLFSFSSLGDGPILTEILSQRAVETKKQPTNQPLCCLLAGCFGFNGPFQSMSGRLPKRGRKRRERIDESKDVQKKNTRTYCERSRPLPYWIQIVGRPGTGSSPSIIAPRPHTHTLCCISYYVVLVICIKEQ